MTAEIVAGEACSRGLGRGLRIRPDARLREIDPGIWEGLSFEEARALYPKEYAEHERDPVGYRFPGGESFGELRERVVPAFLEMADGGEDSLLVVAHQGVNRVLLCEFLGLPLERLFSIRQGYGSVNVIKASTAADGSRRVEVATLPIS